MFVYNVKLDAKKIVKIGFVCLLIGIIIMFLLSLYKIFPINKCTAEPYELY